MDNTISGYILSPVYYLDDFYAMDGMDSYDESHAIDIIQKVIDFVMNIQFPLCVYRGINTTRKVENYEGASWTTDKRVAEGFGNKIFTGLLSDRNSIDMEQTIRARVMNLFEHEIYIPSFDVVKIIDITDKCDMV